MKSPLFKFGGLRVVLGEGRGRKIGVPTINFDPAGLPGLGEGVYVCKVLFPKEKFYWGLLHFGPRPTFGEKEVTAEVFLLDFAKNREVPKKLDLEVYLFIRGVSKFESASAMVFEIDRDISKAKEFVRKMEVYHLKG